MATIEITQTHGQGGRAHFSVRPGSRALSIEAGADTVHVRKPDYGALLDALAEAPERDIRSGLIYEGLTLLAESIRAESEDPSLLRFAACLEAMAQGAAANENNYDSEKALLAALADGHERDGKKL